MGKHLPRLYHDRFRGWINNWLAGVSRVWHRCVVSLLWAKNAAQLRKLTGSEEFNHEPKLIFLHVPKTAGNSFAALCRRNYPGEVAIHDNGRYVPEEWLQAKVVGGHFFFDGFRDVSPQHLFLAVVRDPVERALSRFRWYQQREQNRQLRERRGFDHDCLRRTIGRSHYRFQFIGNMQCRYLAGKKTFEAAKDVIQTHRFILGDFNRLAEWAQFVSERLSWQVTDLPVRNRVADTAPSTDDEELLEILRRENSEDQKLYDWVRGQGLVCTAPADYDYGLLRPDGPT